jgi:hypothetical protein
VHRGTRRRKLSVIGVGSVDEADLNATVNRRPSRPPLRKAASANLCSAAQSAISPITAASARLSDLCGEIQAQQQAWNRRLTAEGAEVRGEGSGRRWGSVRSLKRIVNATVNRRSSRPPLRKKSSANLCSSAYSAISPITAASAYLSDLCGEIQTQQQAGNRRLTAEDTEVRGEGGCR